MATDFRYSLINTFRAIDSWRNNILFNLGGAEVQSFKVLNTDLELNVSMQSIQAGIPGSANRGSTLPVQVPTSELKIQGTSFAFTQGTIQNVPGQPVNLAIQGDGFFAVAESLQPGARVFLTRAGNFHWEETDQLDPNARTNPNGFKRFNLVNDQGLFVLRAQDIDPTTMRLKNTIPGGVAGMMVEGQQGGPWNLRDAGPTLVQGNPPTGTLDPNQLGANWGPDATGSGFQIWGIPQSFVNGSTALNGAALPNPGDSNSDQQKATDFRNGLIQGQFQAGSSLAIVRVPLKDGLTPSSYGATTYDISLGSRPGISVLSYQQLAGAGPNRDPNFRVYSFAAEQTNQVTLLQDMQFQEDQANQVFKELNQMLTDFNNNMDQLFNLVK